MFSLPEMGILGVLALLLFGPEKLPGIMRQVGKVTREVQATSQTFIREMERAADVNDPPAAPYAPPEYRDDEPPLPDESSPPDESPSPQPRSPEAPTAPPPTGATPE